MVADHERLPARIRRLLQDRDNDIYLSVASAWEISIKYALGRLRLPEPPSTYMPTRIDRSGMRLLGISLGHATRVSELPPHHRDPFDRLLVAQAQLERMPIVSADRALRAYDVEVLAR